MRLPLLALLLSSFFLAGLIGCAPDSDSTIIAQASPDPVQTQNFKDLTSVKWCQTPEANDHVYMSSWIFNNDSTTKWVITDVVANKVQREVLAFWKIEKDVLKISEQAAGTEILSKQFSIKYDLSTAKKVMTWIPVQLNQCGSSGDCTHAVGPGEVIVLTECQ